MNVQKCLQQVPQIQDSEDLYFEGKIKCKILVIVTTDTNTWFFIDCTTPPKEHWLP